ncbi:MAG: peptidoglycan DD-metalloendopeptidase family protein [Gemmatimonadota bacterium]|nr:MAG: peptidoglycan DD-metalloendopeptidase family protein [Gemmatimonadota bacterium]
MSGLAEELVRLAGWEVLFSVVLFVIVLGLTRVLRNASPVLRHGLWGLVLLRLLLPVDLSLPFSLGDLAARAQLSPSVEGSWVEEWALSDGAQPEAVTLGDAALVDSGTWAESGAWTLLLGALWLGGVVVVGGVIAERRRRYRRVIGGAAPVREARVDAIVRRWKRRLGVRRRVRMVTSGDLQTPFTSGSLRPVVYLPRAVLRCEDRGVLEAVVAHELAHVKRWDDLQLKFQLAVSVLYFFNPVAWLAASKMREESERICDALVLSRGDLSPLTYGRSVVAVLRLGLPDGPGVMPALGYNKKSLHMRIKSIMKMNGPAGRHRRVVYSLPAALAFGLFLLPMAGASSERSVRSVEDDAATTVEQARTLAQEPGVRLANPMPGSRVSAAWGPMINPFTGKEQHHRGVDLAGQPSAQVQAAGAGVVEEATTDYSGGADHGTVVILDHGGGVKTFYSHLDSLAVQKGQRVSSGDVLGTQGSTGKTTGPHLHFEVWVNGEFVDPALYVTDWRGRGHRLEVPDLKSRTRPPHRHR